MRRYHLVVRKDVTLQISLPVRLILGLFYFPESDEGEPRNLKHTLTRLSHQELKQWHCARMSPEEFTWRVVRQEIAVLDIRSPLE